MIFLIFLIFFTVNGAKSSPNGDCSIDGVTDEQWQTLYTNDPVDDNTINPFKVFNTENINSVSARGDDFQIYFDVKLEGNVITIAPTAEFKNYEIQETHDAQPTINIILDCICNTGRDSLSFMQPIKDLNTYNPSFTQASYSFKLPMPLPADISLQCLTSTKIEACDDDISNIQLLFSINPPEDFTVISGGSIDASGRCYTVLIESAKPLTLTETTTYELMVTDTGNPASSSPVPLVIEINEQTAVPTNPQFISAYYTAVYDNTNEKHSITVNGAITLDKNDPSLSVTSIGEFKDNFDIVNNEGTITVTLKVNLPETTINEEVIEFLTLEANILNAQGPGRTVLAIYMPKKECPTTEAPIPTTACPTTEIPTECPICTTEASTVCTTEAPTECPVCTTETPTECPVCTTETPTECPVCTTETPTECPVCTTETPTECPVCTTETPTECPVCTTETPTECPVFTTETPTECPVCTTETPTECPVFTTEISTVCPVCTTETTACPETPAVTECPTWSTTPNTSECPITECPTTTTTSTVTACPTPSVVTECPTSITTCPPSLSTTATPPSVIFLEDEYKFDVISEYNGKIGTVKAVAIPTENIEYSIVNDGENLVPNQLKIDKNSGVLTLSVNIDVGVYRVKAQASGISSGVKATANVEINIYIKTDTSEVLIVNTIEENTASSLLLPCPGTETTCSYDIISQYPETDQPIFVYQDGKLNSEGINLQMDQIKDMMNPQFLLNLRLTNTKTTENSTKDDGTWNWLYLPETIPRDPSTLLVSVIIRDVNNNPPTFSVGNKLTVGYPAKALQNVLTPPYLVQVQATDLDKGMNGVIRYTSNDINFVVLPKTGVVYPGDNAFNDDSNKQFSIVASDMDGAVDAQTSTLNIEVKLLRQENLVFLTIQNKVLEDLVEVLEDLSDKTKLRINYLTAAVVSKDESQSTKANENYAIKLVIYALNSNNEVVTSDVLEKTLEETEDVEDISTDNWTPEVGAGVEETSTTGYIAAIAVLAVLLVIFMITGGVVYYLKIYKRRSNSKPYDSMTEDSGSIKFEKPQTDEVDDMSKRRPTGYVFNPPPIDEDEDNDSTDKKYESIPNKGWPVDSEIYNDPEDMKRSNEPNYDYDHKLDVIESAVDSKDPNEPRERTDSLDDNNTARKSVSFKQIVEKINIVVDNDKQDDEDVNVCL